MRKLFPLFAVMALFAAVSIAPALAFEDKEVTLTGEGVCAKCALSETPTCQNAVKVEEGGKTVTYYLAKNKVSNDYHSNVCKSSAKTKVTGTVKEEDGKKILTATKIEKVD